MEKLGRMARGRFYLALTYLVWSLLPHFHVLIHSHAGDSHFHAAYSATEVETANRVMETLGTGYSDTGSQAGFGGEAKPASSSTVGSSSGDISRPDPGSELHGHFLEDPNLAGLASQAQSIPSRSFLASPAASRYQEPSFCGIGRPSARGPPAFVSA